MKIKAIDASLIADKALDIYSSRVMKFNVTASAIKNRSSSTKSSVLKIFDEVLDAVVAECRGTYDKIVVCVGCFPLMRMKSAPSLMTRLICKNSIFLREHGVSSSQFLDYFEKYVQMKCQFEKTEHYDGYVVFLKEKYTFCSDWMRILSEHFGSAILDRAECELFSSNPRFIVTMESQPDMFTEFPKDVEYKDRKIVESI